ncbi:MAG: ABC transporter substrate-binding protein [Chloroflexi bacterium]|nr:ABC transporter substrate-binding protein [Chloroflexota bacterium]
MSKKRFMVLSILMVVAMLLSACGPAVAPTAGDATKAPGGEAPAGDGTVYKVGLIVPLSGDAKTFGISTMNGVMMAVEEAKAEGFNIDILVEDGKCDAQEGTNAATKLITQDKVHYIIGAVCSSESLPVSVLAEQNKVVQITPPSTNPAVTVNEDGTVKQYVFRACFLDPFQGVVMAALAKELGATKAAILYDVSNDYVKGLAEYAKESFEQGGGEVAVFEAYTKNDTDFSAILSKVADANVDVIFLPDYYNKVNLIAQQIKEKGITATMIGGDGWDSSDLELDLMEGGYFSNHYSPQDPRDVVQNFVKNYQTKYNSMPDSFATLGYDAAKILIQAIQEAGTDDTTLVAQKMAAIQYSGVTGDISFDEQHNPIKKAAIIKISGGQTEFFKFVAP